MLEKLLAAINPITSIIISIIVLFILVILVVSIVRIAKYKKNSTITTNTLNNSCSCGKCFKEDHHECKQSAGCREFHSCSMHTEIDTTEVNTEAPEEDVTETDSTDTSGEPKLTDYTRAQLLELLKNAGLKGVSKLNKENLFKIAKEKNII